MSEDSEPSERPQQRSSGGPAQRLPQRGRRVVREADPDKSVVLHGQIPDEIENLGIRRKAKVEVRVAGFRSQPRPRKLRGA